MVFPRQSAAIRAAGIGNRQYYRLKSVGENGLQSHTAGSSDLCALAFGVICAIDMPAIQN
jgi:hypothetical protein